MTDRRPAFSCVYCGGAHDTAAEVRACWERTGGVEAEGQEHGDGAPPREPDEPTLFDAPAVATVPLPAQAPSPPPEPRGGRQHRAVVAGTWRGPHPLGRHVLVRPGQDVPPDWSDAPRVRLSSASDTELTGLLRHTVAAQGCVVETDLDLARLYEAATDAPPHELGPRHTFTGEALAHLAVSNSLDLRGGTARWPVLDAAVATGARLVDDGHGDIELPDGTRAWLDGGPPRWLPPLDGLPVLHRVTVEHGSLRPPAGNATSADLAADQLAGVTHPGGTARIIAPAGSGKTRVLTERARHLVQQWNVPPSAICLVAFNKRAQGEMRARTADVGGLQVRTLNSIALAVVNGSAPFARQATRRDTIDEPQVRRLIGSLVKFPRKRNADPVATWIEALSLARLGLVAPAEVEARYGGEVEGFTTMYPRFRQHLARHGQVDYDEQVLAAIDILLTQPAARHAAHRACRWMLVDEFQDLTPAHLLLVRLLAGPDAAVFAVGDDDQTIYGYNGADPTWLIDFATLFPGAGDHPLEVNYRCPGGIVRAADTLLRHNVRRVAKAIRPAPEAADRDGFMVAGAEGTSVATTVQAVQTALAAGTAPHEIAVLTRVNSLLVPVQVALAAAGVPTSGGVGTEFLERTAVRAGLAWLRLATGGNQWAPSDVAEAFRRPSRSVHPRIADWVGEQRSLDALTRLAGRMNNERDAQQVEGFVADVVRMQQLAATRGTTEALMTRLRDQVGLARSIAGLDNHRRGMNRAAQNDDLTALAQLASLQQDPAEFERWLRHHLGRASSATGVTLATVHRVKGQEWPFVVVHHADADQFPHRLAEDVEEERRLFHVAITRAARDVLVVPGDDPSPFILDCSTEPRVRRTAAAPGPSPARAARSGTAPPAKPGEGLPPADATLFERLRELRRHLAAGKPAYTVLADAALHAIAAARPSSLDELAAIKGVGPAKLAQYGNALLDLVAESAEENRKVDPSSDS
ncbi:MAG: ATP-dependent DNA helicase UvrD2 [Ilumatobacteraceae bacterium]|nr:ATP-dependent DNA helicase UvrD2 [Ilumatobacteraceae bacterium]